MVADGAADVVLRVDVFFAGQMSPDAVPLLQLEVLGTHTLRRVAQAMFAMRFERELDEDLDAHLWHFALVRIEDSTFLDVDRPLCSPEDEGVVVYPTPSDRSELREYDDVGGEYAARPEKVEISVGPPRGGDPLVFEYDYGSPTSLLLRVASKRPIRDENSPPGESAASFPRRVTSQQRNGGKRPREGDDVERAAAAAAAADPVVVDRALPSLVAKLGRQGSRLDVGRGITHPATFSVDPDAYAWTIMWSGGGHFATSRRMPLGEILGGLETACADSRRQGDDPRGPGGEYVAQYRIDPRDDRRPSGRDRHGHYQEHVSRGGGGNGDGDVDVQARYPSVCAKLCPTGARPPVTFLTVTGCRGGFHAQYGQGRWREKSERMMWSTSSESANGGEPFSTLTALFAALESFLNPRTGSGGAAAVAKLEREAKRAATEERKMAEEARRPPNSLHHRRFTEAEKGADLAPGGAARRGSGRAFVGDVFDNSSERHYFEFDFDLSGGGDFAVSLVSPGDTLRKRNGRLNALKQSRSVGFEDSPKMLAFSLSRQCICSSARCSMWDSVGWKITDSTSMHNHPWCRSVQTKRGKSDGDKVRDGEEISFPRRAAGQDPRRLKEDRYGEGAVLLGVKKDPFFAVGADGARRPKERFRVGVRAGRRDSDGQPSGRGQVRRLRLSIDGVWLPCWFEGTNGALDDVPGGMQLAVDIASRRGSVTVVDRPAKPNLRDLPSRASGGFQVSNWCFPRECYGGGGGGDCVVS